jgi:hypothetical protein
VADRLPLDPEHLHRQRALRLRDGVYQARQAPHCTALHCTALNCSNRSAKFARVLPTGTVFLLYRAKVCCRVREKAGSATGQSWR